MVAAPGLVGQVGAFRDDPFVPEAAGVLEDGRPVVLGEMLSEADAAGGLRADDLGQQALAVDERCLGEIEAFAIKQIERIEAEAVLTACAYVGLQMVEARQA